MKKQTHLILMPYNLAKHSTMLYHTSAWHLLAHRDAAVKCFTPCAADQLAISAALNWIRGPESLATTPWQQKQQQQQCSASWDEWNTICRTGNQLGSRKTGATEGCSVCLPNRSRIRSRAERQRQRVSVSRNLFRGFGGLLLCLCFCLSLSRRGDVCK